MPLASVSTDPSFVDPTSTVAVDALAADPRSLFALDQLADAQEKLGNASAAEATRTRIKYLRAPTVEGYLLTTTPTAQ